MPCELLSTLKVIKFRISQDSLEVYGRKIESAKILTRPQQLLWAWLLSPENAPSLELVEVTFIQLESNYCEQVLDLIIRKTTRMVEEKEE